MAFLNYSMTIAGVRSIFAQQKYIGKKISPVISVVIRQKFTKFLDDLGPSSPQLDHDIAIRFLALVQRMQVDVDNIFTTLFGCHGNVP